MIVVCAWCEQEAEQALKSGNAQADESLHSHGICESHERLLIRQIETQRKKYPIRHIPRRLCLPNARGSKAPITAIYL